MKKTYITTMPNHIGAFLKASECFASLGINITRVSYNKAIDSHTLFIDVEGKEDKLKEADRKLTEIGYLQQSTNDKNITLLEFRLSDVPGSVTEILRLIEKHHLNISYMSSQENGSDYQYFKMGLFVDDENELKEFIKKAEGLCRVKVIDYNHSATVYDNSIFYNSFVSGIMQTLGISNSDRNALLVNSNMVMQTLDERGLSPYKTFESISRFAELLSACRGQAFSPRISNHKITDNTELTLIEPPCGSNTIILKSFDKYLFIDSGYALYHDEMAALFKRLIPGFENMEKTIFVTHADVDHCGLLPVFDKVIASVKTQKCLEAEYNGEDGFREKNYLHKPYVSICKILTSYKPVSPDVIEGLWDAGDELREPLTQAGFFDFGEMHFEVYEGKGGHLQGETVLIDYAHHVAFTGDIFINTHGLTKEQAEYNQYAPVLMTSVDTDPALCALERKTIFQRLGTGNWQIFGSHGYKKEYVVNEII